MSVRLFSIVVLLMAGHTIMQAQRLREFDVWTSEAYARKWITNDVTMWNGTRWVVDSTYGLYNMQPDALNPGFMMRVAASGRPDYSLNYERVRSLMSGRYYGAQDTTINGETQYVTPIPSIMLLQSIPRVGPPGVQMMQIFSVESRGYRVMNPIDSRPRDGGLYRDNNIEGLGVRRDALDSAIVSKYDIMLEGSHTTHPTHLNALRSFYISWPRYATLNSMGNLPCSHTVAQMHLARSRSILRKPANAADVRAALDNR